MNGKYTIYVKMEMIKILNIKNNKDKKVSVQYNTKNGVKIELEEFKELIDIKGDNIVPDYTCLNENRRHCRKRFNYFLNTVLQLPEKFINKLEFPKLCFYDIETNSADINDNNVKINSIAWIDDNKEYCLIKGVNGSEKEIIEQFIDYCKKNNIMGLVGHNSNSFDNKIMIKRCKHHKINYNLFYNHCNLDTMILASFLQFTNSKYISLSDLADTLEIEENKTDTGIYNPVTLYNEAIKEYKDDNEEKIKLFREYNMQDVRLCKSCFEEMNVKPQLTELFKQSRCPFNKMQYNAVLLNHYTCKYLHSRNIKISESVNTEIKFENKGGYNYYRESDELQVYNNVLVADIVSYYPHLLMLINADPYNQYENINRETGEIKPFEKNDKVGLICELSKGLYESRAETKKEMEQTEDKELREQLNYEQLTKKIIVNSLYGLLNQKNGNYILKNDLIAATITKMGRDILQHIVKKFGAVYAKTDSVFIPLEKNDEPEFIINTLNIEVSKFIKDKYNLNNVTSNGQLIKFEEDSITDKLVLKDKNNYVKIDNNEYKFKGSDFNSSTLSDFEKDNIKTILKHIDLLEAGESGKLKGILIENTKNTLKDVSDVKYFSKSKKLSKDQKDQRIIKDGIKYMENEDLPYNYGFPYLYCGVEDDKYNYIMFPKGYNPDLKINPVFVYDLLFKQMKKLKIINNKTKKELDKKYNIKNLNDKSEQVKGEYITNKDSVDLDNYNETVKDEKENINSYRNLYRKIGGKIKELIIMKMGNNKTKPPKAWEKLTKTNIKALKNYKGNIGIVFNPESQYKYGFIDIDGFKEDLTEEENREFKKDLYNLLKSNRELYNHSVVQRTQSGGYHFIFKHNETDIINNRYMNGFKVPTQLKEDYKLKKHDKLGTGGSSGAIEIFINMKKYCMVYPSEVKPNKSYEIIHVGKEFGKPLKNIKKQLKKVFGDNKETTKKYKGNNKVKKENNIKTNSELKNKFLNNFLEDTKLFNLFCEEFKNRVHHHNQILGVYTAILKFIGLEDDEAVSYMDRIINEADPADYDEHIKQVESYIDSNDGTKPNYIKHLNDDSLILELRSYFDSFESIKLLNRAGTIRFGEDVKKEGSYYEQTESGIQFVKTHEDNNGNIHIETTNVANMVIKNITIFLDALKILKPVYSITYKNLTYNQIIKEEHLSSQQLTEKLIEARVFNKPNKNEVETVINNFIIDTDKVEVKEEAFLKGFWLVKDKIISNTEIKDLEYNKEDLKKAIQLLNEVIKSRSKEGKRNDCTVYRFMLYSPFSYCLKQLGYGDSNYSLILIGASQTNKSGSIKIANHFYNHTEEETTGSTVSVLGSKLEENSFPTVFDECDHLFKLNEANNVMKRAIYEKDTRATKDRNDNKKIDNFKAFGLPVFLLNEPQEFKDYITNRYKVIHYSNESIITNLNKEEFNKEYKPKSPYTSLKALHVLGKVFSEKMIKILEDSEQHNKLFSIENTIISILQEIGEEAGIDFIEEMYEPTIASTQYNYDVKEVIKEVLNNEFKNKNRLIGSSQYGSHDFVKSIANNDFPFIYYNRDRTAKTADRHYIIDTPKFVKYINQRIDVHIEIETILESLDLTEILQHRANESNKNYSEYIARQYKFIHNNKQKNVKGFYLTTDELIKNLFSIDLDLTEE